MRLARISSSEQFPLSAWSQLIRFHFPSPRLPTLFKWIKNTLWVVGLVERGRPLCTVSVHGCQGWVGLPSNFLIPSVLRSTYARRPHPLSQLKQVVGTSVYCRATLFGPGFGIPFNPVIPFLHGRILTHSAIRMLQPQSFQPFPVPCLNDSVKVWQTQIRSSVCVDTRIRLPVFPLGHQGRQKCLKFAVLSSSHLNYSEFPEEP